MSESPVPHKNASNWINKKVVAIESSWEPSQRHTILVVDDSDDLRALVRFVLESMGHKVIEAPNGLAAVEIAVREQPNLILMDLAMPVLDGFGSALAIKSEATTSSLPIIAVSAHDSRDHRIKASAVGFSDYLTKPINFSELSEKLKKWLNFGNDSDLNPSMS